MPTHLDEILAPGALRAVFQPVVDLTDGARAVFAYEGLIRGPVSTNFAEPDVIFGYVRRKRHEDRVDRACVAAILREARALPAGPLININVHAATLARARGFVDEVVGEAERTGIDPSRVVVEIVEHGSAWNEPRFLGAIERVRACGLRVALDDIGAGLSNYKMILDTHPDFFKIDRYVVTGCDRDSSRKKVLTSIRDLAAAFGARAIAEGVEIGEEARTLLSLGIELMQGYLFARPQSAATLRAMDEGAELTANVAEADF